MNECYRMGNAGDICLLSKQLIVSLVSYKANIEFILKSNMNTDINVCFPQDSFKF